MFLSFSNHAGTSHIKMATTNDGGERHMQTFSSPHCEPRGVSVMKSSDTYPTLAFETQHDWEMWLEQHHHEAKGVWLKLAKKATSIPSITHAEAVDGALCYGWIDS